MIEAPALLLAHRLQGQLVVISQEETPLAGGGQIGSVPEDVGDGAAVGVANGQEHARHEGKVEGHVELVAVAEVGTHLGRPLVRLGEEDTALVVIVDLAPDLAEERVGLGQVLAVGAVALEEIGDGIAAESVEPRSSQNCMASSTSRRTVGLSRLRSG